MNKKELSGKYAELAIALQKAVEIGKKASENVVDDGNCNMDAPAIKLPRWREAGILEAAKSAGVHCTDWTIFGEKYYVFVVPSLVHANARSVMAEAMCESLKMSGYETMLYCESN